MRITNLANNRRNWLSLLLVFILSWPLILMASQPEELSWDDLLPKDWNPSGVFDRYTTQELTEMSDEQYDLLVKEAQSMLDAAPTVDSLDGKMIKIPGFILPLEFDDSNIREFLLVPYFGACVHTPPPPANQVIYGKLEHQFTMSELFEPVWISGQIKAIRSTTELGETDVNETLNVETGYTMDVSLVEPYTEEDS